MSRRKRRADDDERDTFDWQRAAQLDALNRMALPDRLTGLGRPVRRMTLISVLRVIDDFQRKKHETWPHLSTIATHARCSVKTVERVLDCAESLGILTVWEERRRRAPLLKMAINWERVFAEHLPAKRYETHRRPRSRQNDTGSRQNDTGSRQNDTGSGALYTRNVLRNGSETSPPSPPLAKRPSGAADHPAAATWEEVEEELMRLGVNAFPAAVKEARRSVDAAHVLALCEHFERHWQPGLDAGLLYIRVLRARPWLNVTEGWPSLTRVATPTPVTSASGEDLDRLTVDELDELIATDATLRSMAALCRSADELRSDPTGRQLLLRRIARNAGQECEPRTSQAAGGTDAPVR